MSNSQFSIKEFLLNLIFPKECLNCGQADTYLCNKCFSEIQLNEKKYCALCKSQNSNGEICPVCGQNTSIKAIWLAANYDNEILQNLIHSLKYNYIEELADILAEVLKKYFQREKIEENFNLHSDNTILVPVPLHKKRKLSRGFNQSELLAKKFGEQIGFKVGDLLARTKNTQTQIGLNRSERQVNMKNAFITKPDDLSARNKKIILMDDVVTTGSTLLECAKALTQAGFNEIYALVIAQRED